VINEINARIFAKRTDLLYRNGLVANSMIVFVATALTVLLHDAVNRTQLFIWLVCILLLSFFRFLLIVWHLRNNSRHSSIFWSGIYTYATILVGLCWTWITLIGFVEDEEIRMIMVFVVMGLTSISIPVLISHPLALFGYFGPPRLHYCFPLATGTRLCMP
jgi:hypothetical protein